MIRIDDERYRLYAAVDPATNHLRHIRLFSTYTAGLTQIFLRELREKHDVEQSLFLVDGATTSKLRLTAQASDFSMNATEIETAPNVSAMG